MFSLINSFHQVFISEKHSDNYRTDKAFFQSVRYTIILSLSKNIGNNMKIQYLAISAFIAMGIASTSANAGCLKGAVIGGVAGHVAGKHGIVGAGAGCAVGSHMSKKKAKQQAAATQTAAPATSTTPATTTK